MVPAIWILAVVAVVFLLKAAAALLIPIVVALLISYAFEPVVAWLARHHVPRIAGATLLLVAVPGVSAHLVYSLRDDALEAVKALPDVAERLRSVLWTDGDSPARHVREAAEALQSAASGEVPADAASDDTPASRPTNDVVLQWLHLGIGSMAALAGHVAVVVFLVFFLLVAGGHFRERLVEVAGGTAERHITARIVDDINRQVQRFLLVQLVTAIVVAVATWAAMAWLGLAQPAVWGVLAGVLNSIPYMGPVVVSGGLLLVAWVQSGDMGFAAQVSLVALAITSLEGWLLTPPLLGRAERIHVLVVFLGVLLWTWLWGAWGTILAVPMLVVVKAVADHVERLRPLSRLRAP